MSKTLRIIFAGTPDFAARHLDALLSSGHQVVGVFTQPDRPAGRGKKLMPSPVKVLAEEHGLPVYQPASLRPQENQELVADLNDGCHASVDQVAEPAGGSRGALRFAAAVNRVV